MAEDVTGVRGVKTYRWVRPAVLAMTLGALLLIPFKVVSYGYMPADDALRHAAKAVTGRPWTEILVVRDGITMDSHPGWHAVLGFLHRVADAGPDALVLFSVVALCLVFLLTPALFLGRSEAWLATLAALCLIAGGWTSRLFLGRPYILTMTAVMVFGFQAKRLAARKTHWGAVTTFAAAVALSVWLNCTWYLWALPVAAMLLAREWRGAVRTAAAVSAGVLAGACLSGNPVTFLWQNLHHLFLTMGSCTLTRQLVTELQPSGGECLLLILVAFLLLWRRARGSWRRAAWDNPVFLLAALGWGLGILVWRFSLDWGMPALCAWTALELQPVLARHFPRTSLRRLALAAVLCALAFALPTRDIGGRWSSALRAERLSAVDPTDPARPSSYAEWLPDPGGVFYTDSMALFYSTFYANPDAKWRYILGFESGWMPQEDLEILRRIQWNGGAFEAYAPWVKKMRPEDRLVLDTGPGAPPRIDGLEWKYAVTNVWIGRLPRKAPPSDAPAAKPEPAR